MIKKNNIFVYPLEGKVIFPYHQYSFSITTTSYEPQLYDNLIGFVTKIDSNEKGVEKIQNVSRFGSLLKIHKAEVTGYRVTDKTKSLKYNFYGLTFARFRISTLTKVDDKMLASIEIYPDEISKETQAYIQKKNLLTYLKKQVKIFYDCKLKMQEAEIKKQLIDSEKSVNKIIYKCIDQIDSPMVEKLKFLQINKQEVKIELLLTYLSQKTQNLKSVIDLEEKVRQELTKQSAKKIVSQQFGFNNMGRGSGDLSEIEQKIKSKNLPDHVKEEIQKQMKRMGGQAQSAVTLRYIETLLQIPWREFTEDVKDLEVAEKILNEDHTGLKQVKQRILEFLAVKFRNGNTKGNILCLHGPPGVGKTSIAKSIAKALNRQFTRISLGGMNDEAELRGHRRTYVAALPGKIIRALIKAKSSNPVILLDQIQKIGKSHRGDPQHALLQILDPSQNSSFVDHYVSIPVDLSKVMFICTANTLQLSGPLLNRLQMIQIPGYTREQKIQIAQRHLIPVQIKENGVQNLISIETNALKEIVKHSKEMGVRELQRNIAKICRKVARTGKKQSITKERVIDILGKRDDRENWEGIGIVNGMAWTQMGGKLLMVQAIKYSSEKPKVQITGQLGDVMKQSVNIALSWIKSNKNQLIVWKEGWGQNIEDLQKISIHLHFPAGGIKKDGPSAGITIVNCLVSLMLKMPVRSHLSMTGEITLTGRVLPVGGVRQKCIAAIYEGIQHIIIPYDNIKDLQKIPNQLKKNVTFYPVKQIRQALGIAFPILNDKSTAKL